MADPFYDANAYECGDDGRPTQRDLAIAELRRCLEIGLDQASAVNWVKNKYKQISDAELAALYAALGGGEP